MEPKIHEELWKVAEMFRLLGQILKDMHISDGVEDCAGWDEYAMAEIVNDAAHFILSRNEVGGKIKEKRK